MKKNTYNIICLFYIILSCGSF